MKAKGLGLLSAVTVLAVLAAGVLVGRAENPTPNRVGTVVFPGLESRINDVRTIEIAKSEAAFTIERTEGGWALRERDGYPVRFDKVKSTLVTLADMKTIEAATRRIDLYEKLQLNEPGRESASGRIVLRDGSGTEIASLIVGTRAYGRGAAQEQMYIRKPHEEQAWLVKGVVDTGRRAVEWLERDIINIPRARVREITISQESGPPVVIRQLAGEDSKFELVDIPEGRSIKAPVDVWSVAGALENVELDDVARADTLGFDPAVAPQAVLKTHNGLVVSVRVAAKGDDKWVIFQAAVVGDDANAQAEAQRINARVGGHAYQLQGTNLSRLETQLEGLLDEKKKAAR